MGLIGKRIVQRHIGEQHSALKGALEARQNGAAPVYTS